MQKMTDEKRKRIVREVTPEEKERHRVIREQVQQDLPELRAWARAAAARHHARGATPCRARYPCLVVCVRGHSSGSTDFNG
jgi:hypothetical protein